VGSHTGSPAEYLKSDGDEDPDDEPGRPGRDDQKILVAMRYGASSADRRAIASVVRSYYYDAAAANGAKGCLLLDSSLATAVAEEPSQSPHVGASTCAASLSRLFEQQHLHLAEEEVSTMVVTGVHVNGTLGLSTLGFRAAIEAEIVLQREGRTWKMAALFDSPLP
jgi:hypothetical protein